MRLKIVMALTGAVMLLYLVVHMLGNLKIFFGEQALDIYAGWLREVGEPALPGGGMLWIVRVVLLVSVVAHIVAATILARRARVARPVKYAHRPPVQTGYAARTISRWYVTLAYAVAMVALGFHLRHGIWSALQTLGRSSGPDQVRYKAIALVFAVVLTAGFLAVPFAVQFGLVAR